MESTAGPNASQTFAVGEVVTERFRIVGFLGCGGMGEVYDAEDLDLGERVALKTLRTDAADFDGLMHRFRREIHLARQITHPHVCRVYDVFRHRRASREVVFLSMELLSGETLAERLRRVRRFEPAEALAIARQIAAGLAAIHARHIIHRDLKSSNVMLVPDPADGHGCRAVVTDFGLARLSAPDETTQFSTDAGIVVGTPAYMAPEQVEGKPLGVAADIYAFGVCLYEMTCGRLPFIGESALAVAVKRLNEAPPRPRDFAPDLPVQWERVILRCLERDPEARFSSANEVIRALESATPGSASWRTTRGVPLWRMHPPERWIVGVALAGVILAVLAALTLPFGSPARPGSVVDTEAEATERSPDLATSNGSERPTMVQPTQPSVEIGALQRLAANALARRDFEGALQAIAEAVAQKPDDPVVEKHLNDLLSSLLRDVGRALEPTPPEDPQAATYHRLAAAERIAAIRLADAGRKVDAVRSLIAARKNLDRARSIARSRPEGATPAETSSRGTPPSATQAPVPAEILAQQPPPAVIGDVPPASMPENRAESPPLTAAPESSVPGDQLTVADREGVNAVLQQYVTAYERRDSAALRRIWPSMPASLATELASARSYRLELVDPQVTIDKDSATVTCIRRISFLPDVGREQSASPPTVIVLQRGPAGWMITDVR